MTLLPLVCFAATSSELSPEGKIFFAIVIAAIAK